MKTQILRLEPHDDPASIRDKLAWKQVGRVMLVLPGKGDAGLCNRLNNRLHLQLIRREAQKMGAQIALITTHRGLERTATEMGLPVFQSIKEAHKSRWVIRDYAQHSKTPRYSRNASHRLVSRTFFEEEQVKHHPRLHLLKKDNPGRSFVTTQAIWIPALLLGILTLITAALILIPRVSIALPAKERTQTAVIQVLADPELDAVDILGRVPIHTASGIIQKDDMIASSGFGIFPERAATGMLELSNLSDEPLTLATGARLAVQIKTGDSIFAYYQLVKDTVLPPVKEAAKPITAGVQAEIPGSIGNLPGGYYFALQGPLGSRLTAFNPDPIQGGRDVRLPAPTTRDRAVLLDRLTATLLEAAVADLTRSVKSSSAGAEGIVLPDSVKFRRVVAKDYVPASENAPANQLSLTMQIEYEGKIIRGDDFSQLASLALAADLQPGFEPAGELLITTSAVQPDSSGRVRLELRAKRLTQQIVDRPALVKILRGKTAQEAAHILKTQFQLADTPEIILSPSWWRNLPFFDFQYAFAE